MLLTFSLQAVSSLRVIASLLSRLSTYSFFFLRDSCADIYKKQDDEFQPRQNSEGIPTQQYNQILNATVGAENVPCSLFSCGFFSVTFPRASKEEV